MKVHNHKMPAMPTFLVVRMINDSNKIIQSRIRMLLYLFMHSRPDIASAIQDYEVHVWCEPGSIPQHASFDQLCT